MLLELKLVLLGPTSILFYVCRCYNRANAIKNTAIPVERIIKDIPIHKMLI